VKVVRLELHNYRRHRDTRLEFPDGVVAVVGPNGAGKSTLVEAIGFALFGPRAAGTGKDLIRSEDAPPGDSVRVMLELELGGQAVRVVRELRGKAQGPFASLEVDGHVQVQPIAGSSEQVTQQMERLLGLDREGFFQTVVARQRDLDRLGRLAPGERRAFILGLVGIGAVDDAIRRARESRSTLLAQVQEAARHVGDAEALAARVAGAETAAATATQRVEAGTAELVAREADATAAAARLDSARQDHAARVALEAQAHGLAAQAQHARRAAERSRAESVAAEQAAARLPDLRAQADGAESAARELATVQGLVLVQVQRTAQVARIAQQEAAVAQAVAQERAIVVPAAPDLAPLALALEAARSQVARIEAAHAVARDRVLRARAESAGLATVQGSGPCPACRQPVTGEHLERERALARARLAEAEGVQAAAVVAERDAKSVAAKAAAALQQQQAVAVRVQALTRQREQAAHQAAALQAVLLTLREGLPPDPGPLADVAGLEAKARQAGALRTALAQAEAALARLPATRAAGMEAERAAQGAEAELAGLQVRLATQPDAVAALAAAGSAASSAGQRLAHARAEHTQALLAHQAADQEVRAARAEQARDVAARARQADLQAQVARWTAVVGAAGGGLLERFREHLVSRAAPAINQEASQLLAVFTQGRYTELVLDDAYDLHMGDGGRLLPLERFSGGEQDLAHLALRLGISRLLATRAGAAELRFLALDEVFSSLDTERCDALLGALRGLTGLYSQVVAVTHLERLQESFDAVVRVRLEDGQASVSLHNG
jgi:exonuclease SbcC